MPQFIVVSPGFTVEESWMLLIVVDTENGRMDNCPAKVIIPRDLRHRATTRKQMATLKCHHDTDKESWRGQRNN